MSSRRLIVTLLALTGSAAVLPTPHLATAAEPKFGVIVQLAASEGAEGLNSRHGSRTLDALAVKPGVFLVSTDDARGDDELAAELSADPAVIFAETNGEVRSPEVTFEGKFYRWSDGAPVDPGAQWAAAALRLDAAHAVSTGRGVTVAVIDTGLSSAALAPFSVPGYDLIDNDGIPADDANSVDDNGNGVVDEAAGHGTFVAGIVHLTAPDAVLLPIRVIDSDGDARSFAVVQAMYLAADNGASVVNMSLGQRGSTHTLRQAVLDLARRNVVVVGAAGNEGLNRDMFPAAAKCALGVTSVGPSGRVSAFASWGTWIDVAAPGEDIVSNFPFTANGQASWSGTSMATPFVSGEVALLQSRRPNLPVQRVLDVIRAAATPVVDPPPGFGTAGRADVAAALAVAPTTGKDCTSALA